MEKLSSLYSLGLDYIFHRKLMVQIFFVVVVLLFVSMNPFYSSETNWNIGPDQLIQNIELYHNMNELIKI